MEALGRLAPVEVGKWCIEYAGDGDGREEAMSLLHTELEAAGLL